MYGCYVEVVFHFVAKAILFLCFFGFDIYPYILFHFLKCFLLFLLYYIITHVVSIIKVTKKDLVTVNSEILAVIVVSVIVLLNCVATINFM